MSNKTKAVTLHKEVDTRSNLSYGSEIIAEHGWLSPKGIFHPCEFGDHEALAQTLLGYTEANWQDFYDNYSGDLFYEELERRGWLKIQDTLPLEPDHVCIGCDWYITKGQYAFIRAYLQLHGKEFLYNIRVRG